MPTTTQRVLPQTKDPAEFESICKDILNIKCQLTFDTGFTKLGGLGQSQGGIDLYAQQRDGFIIVAQCKNYVTLDSAKVLNDKISKDITKIAQRDDVTTVFIMTAKRKNATVERDIMKRNQMTERKFKIVGMFWDDIEEVLLDVANNHLLERYYPDYARPNGLARYNLEMYQNSSRVQLDKWKSSTAKLYNVLYEDNTYISMTLKDDSDNNYTVEEVLTNLREKNCFHNILIGEGGMGKTTTCMRLWTQCLEQNMQVFYVPLCDYNSTNNTIQSYITDVYGVEEHNYNRLMDEKNIVLLLDGFNEIKFEYHQNFLTELRKIANKQAQILITSRTDDVLISKTDGFTKLFFEPLTTETIDKWLTKHWTKNIEDPNITPELYEVLRNPMMLKIYAPTLNDQKKSTATNFNFFKNPNTRGEIIWNFLEHQIKKMTLHEEQKGFTKILFRHLLPYIAYKIESTNEFDFTTAQLEKYVDEFVEYIENYYKKFDALISYRGAIQDFLKKDNKTEYLLDLCKDNFSIIKQRTQGNTDKSYIFIQQYFRDIFSTTHIKNQMILKDKSVFINRVLPIHIYQMLCEILQEHKVENLFEHKYEWVTPSGVVSELRQYLKCFKNGNDREAQTGVFNALQIIDYARKCDLSNEDFSALDLRRCSLNGKNVNQSNFTNSYIDKNVFFSTGHTDEVGCVCFSPNGEFFASASRHEVILWDTKTGKILHTLNCSAIEGVICFSPDGNYLASVSYDVVMLWDSKTGKLLRTLNCKRYFNSFMEHVAAVCFSPDGETLAAASSEKVILWDLKTGKILRLDCSTCRGVNLYFSPNGKTLASTSDEKVMLWNSKTGEPLRTIECSKAIESICFSRDGETFAFSSGGGLVGLYVSETGRLIRTWQDLLVGRVGHTDQERMCLSPDGKTLVFTSWVNRDRERVLAQLYDSESGSLLYTLQDSGCAYVKCFSPDGKIVASASGRSVILWDIKAGKRLHTLESNEFAVNDVCFSPDGKFLASASEDQTVILWDSVSGRRLHTLQGHTDEVASVCFSDYSKILASASENEVMLWDSETWSPLRTLKNRTYSHYHRPINICFSPDGKILAFPHFKSVRLWDSRSGNFLPDLEGHTKPVTDICFSPDSKILASASEDGVRLWNSWSGAFLRTLEGHKESMWSIKRTALYGKLHIDGSELQNEKYSHTIGATNVCFIPNSKILASTSDYSLSEDPYSVLLWDSDTGELLRTLQDHKYGVTGYNCSVCFSPDGKVLASKDSKYNVVRLWDIESMKLLYTLEGHTSKVNEVCFSPDGKTLASASDDGTVKVWDNATDHFNIFGRKKLLKTLYHLSYLKVSGAILKDIESDLTKTELLILKQHGAITD